MAIQIAWIAIVLIAAYYTTIGLFEELNEPWLGITCGLISVFYYALLVYITHFIRALKDPDVQIASELRMSITRYKRYREWFNEHQRIMQIHGCESKEANDYFNSFFKKIKYPNEWRRYSHYRLMLGKEEMLRDCTIPNDSKYDIGDKIILKMDDEEDFLTGEIVNVKNGKYQVIFPSPVSLIESEEPAGGWKDNSWPTTEHLLSEDDIEKIKSRYYVGTSVHFHF